MIPRAHITAWRSRAPWPLDSQVEQDLVLSRALAEIFSRPLLVRGLAFRGGTALHKLYVKLLYRFHTTALPVERMRLKIEINTREHFNVYGLVHKHFRVKNPWYDGKVDITSYNLEELLATKLRALYQRKKGRDLYDLWLALSTLTVDEEAVAACFAKYLEHSRLRVARAEFEANLDEKLNSTAFRVDVQPLLRDGAAYDVDVAAALIQERLLSRLSDSSKGL